LSIKLQIRLLAIGAFMIYSIDFETRSKANLPDVGLDIYANDPTTEVLCIAFGNTLETVNVLPPQNPSTNQLWPLMQHVSKGGKIAPRKLNAPTLLGVKPNPGYAGP
jgi:hypothetical protein